MDVVTVSQKHQVVIHLKVRERMCVKPGHEMHALAYDKPVDPFQSTPAQGHPVCRIHI